jgi:predicted RNA-binding Zn ribbon-like protein
MVRADCPVAATREAFEKDFACREKQIVEREKELAELRTKAAAFPKELENAVSHAVKETADRLKLEAKNVLTARNETLEKFNKDLFASNAKLAQQLEAAYQKVQDIAEKTVEGSSQAKSLADLQKLLVEQSRKGTAEKG